VVSRLLQCLQYKTDQQADLKKVEKLNNLFFALMAKGPDSVGAQHVLEHA
jgi:signal recognition particle subunit SRP9